MPSPDWRIERGIGETRMARIQDGSIVEARILIDGQERAGAVIVARLASAGTRGRNAVTRAGDGQEYLLPRGAPGAAEGSSISIEVTRETIPGSEPWKRPLARFTDLPVGEAPPLVGTRLPFPAPSDALGALGWNDLIDEARSGIVPFPGGELAIEPTRAMTMVDVNGILESNELALLGAGAAARAISRLD
ncbi:MAG: ribonuclease, partial [Sphingomicrobium sp.]